MSTDAGEDNSKPILLNSEGWETLPDGRQQLKMRCLTALDYATMPKQLKFGPVTLHKSGFDSEKKHAFYKSESEDLSGPGERPYLTE